ncbi:20716_t:CDS:10, partial [Entrophospora sp. SA101]
NSSSDEDSDINSENSQSDFENEDKNSLNLKHSSNPVGSNNNGHNEEASNKTILTKNRKNSNSNLQNNCLDTDEIHKTDSNIVDDESEHDNNHNQSTKTTQTRQDYRKKLAEDPSYVPKFGYFWGHDDRFVKEEAENLQDNNNKFRKFPSRNKGGFKNPPTENQWGHDGYEELIRKSSLDHHNTNNHRPNSSNQYHNNSRHHNNNYHYDDNYHHNNNYYYDDNYYYDNNYRHDNHHNYSNNYRHDNNYYHRYDNNHRHNNNYRHANGNNYNHKNKSASYDEDFNDDDVVKKKEPLQNDISPLKDEAVEKKDAINELEIASNEEDAPEITTCIHQEKEIDNVEQKEMKNTNMKSIESKNNASTQPVEPSTTSTASSSKRYSSRRVVTTLPQTNTNSEDKPDSPKSPTENNTNEPQHKLSELPHTAVFARPFKPKSAIVNEEKIHSPDENNLNVVNSNYIPPQLNKVMLPYYPINNVPFTPIGLADNSIKKNNGMVITKQTIKIFKKIQVYTIIIRVIIKLCIHQEKEIDNVEQKEMKNTNMKSIESKNNASTQPVEPSTTSTASSSKRYSSRRVVTTLPQTNTNSEDKPDSPKSPTENNTNEPQHKLSELPHTAVFARPFKPKSAIVNEEKIHSPDENNLNVVNSNYIPPQLNKVMLPYYPINNVPFTPIGLADNSIKMELID